MSAEHHLSFLDHLPLTRRAVVFAEQRHEDQQRMGDGAAYVMHLLEVASLLDQSGYDDHVVAGAVLHDVLEDTDAERWELDAQFGVAVGSLVSAVSDDSTIVGEEERKDDVRERVRRGSEEAAILYAADKVSKVRELRFLMASDPDDPEIDLRLVRYRRSLAMLEERIPGNRIVELLRFELEALVELPPHAIGSALPADEADWPTVTAAALRHELEGLRRELRELEPIAAHTGDEEMWRRAFDLRRRLLSVKSLIDRLENELYHELFRPNGDCLTSGG